MNDELRIRKRSDCKVQGPREDRKHINLLAFILLVWPTTVAIVVRLYGRPINLISLRINLTDRINRNKFRSF